MLAGATLRQNVRLGNEMIFPPNYKSQLRKFDRQYNAAHEAHAAQTRGAFLQDFPLKNLKSLTLSEYVIGTKKPTFCAYVEEKTKPWANVIGATALKFGIY